MALQQYIVRRLALALVTLLITSFLVFTMIRLNPDAVVAARLGENYTQEQAEAVKEEYGLNRPIPTEYVAWVGRVVRGDWGRSAYTYKPVLVEMGPKIAVTLELAMLAVTFAILIGIPVGVLSALRQDHWPDYTLRMLSIFGLSVPGFYVATIVMALLAKNFHWIPDIRYRTFIEDQLGNLQQMALPALILALSTSAQVMRYTRAMMVDIMRQDFIRTAWSKGLRERVVVTRHALKNAMLPVITVLGISMTFLVGGTVIFETLFVLPGQGTHLIRAVQQRDFAVVQGVTLFFALAVVLINLFVDLSYTLLDPRARTS
ncbi:MAG: ABC transporter permease [Dehalococcoidia bacterium]